MKRKFVKVMFFGALALSTVTYVGCKDYDDDVKSLQEQIDSINQKGADVTTEAMNAAINSAIAKVQADLDKIASKADKSALDALQAVVTKLQEAVNGKADASALESLKSELNAAIEAVNSSIQPKIDAAKTQLEGQIEGLEAKLEQADEEIRGSIATQIADLKTELQNLMDANAAEYARLYATKTDLNALSERVETLEQIKHLTNDDVLSFIQTNEDVKKYVDDEFVALLQQNLEEPGSALRAYLEGVFTTGIMTQAEAKCRDIVSAEMTTLRGEWATYKATQDENYNGIVDRLDDLEGYDLSVMEQLYTSLTSAENNTIAKANQCAEALGEITNLETEFGKYTTTTDLERDYVKNSDLNTKIGDYVDSKISGLDTRVGALETKVNALQSGLESMLKSLVFAPQQYDASGELIRSVAFASIYTSTAQTPDGPVVISAPTVVKVNFRVSPASAVADLIGDHPKYTISTNKHVITSRAATDDGILTVASVEQAKDENGAEIDGMITVTLNAATALKSYALSLSVVGNNEEGKDVTNFTEINSDYFAVIVSKSYINAMDYAAKDYDDKNPELLIDKANSSIKFYDATKNSDYIKVKLSDNEDGTSPASDFVTLSSLGLSADLFGVTFEKTGTDKDYFVLTNGVLTVNPEKTPASDRYNKTCVVTPKIKLTTVTTTDGDPIVYTGTAVNTKIVAEGVNLEYTVADQHWRDAQQTVSLGSKDLEAILAKIKEVSGDNSYADLAAAVSAATTSTATDADGVSIASTGGNVTITISAKTIGGPDKVFAPSLKLSYANSAIVNITVKVKVLAPDVTALKLGANTVNWDGKSVVDLMPSADANAMTALTVSRKLSEVLLKADIEAINTAVGAKQIQLRVADGEGTDVSSSVTYPDFIIKQPTASSEEVSYTFSLYYTDKDNKETVLNNNLVTVKLKPSVKVAGVVTPPAEDKRAIELVKLIDTYDLAKDFTWKDFRGVTLWPTFAANPPATMGTETSAFALGVYSGKVEYIVDKDSRATFVNCFNTTGYDAATGKIAAANKTVQLNDTFRGQEGAIANPITVKILVKASTAWGAPANAETELTITYPAGTSK